MKYINDAYLDSATWLLFEVLGNSCVPAKAGYDDSAKQCLKQYKNQFRAATRVLVWLYLAVPDRKNALGCQPTDALMTIIARKPKSRLKSKKTGWTWVDRDAMETLIEAALKKDALDEELSDCAVNVLGALGLVRYRVDVDKMIPTERLSNLVAKRRILDRRMRYAKIETKRNPRPQEYYVPVLTTSS
jgi:hypothetical protein